MHQCPGSRRLAALSSSSFHPHKVSLLSHDHPLSFLSLRSLSSINPLSCLCSSHTLFRSILSSSCALLPFFTSQYANPPVATSANRTPTTLPAVELECGFFVAVQRPSPAQTEDAQERSEVQVESAASRGMQTRERGSQ